MKTFLLGTVALVALGATVPALAADLGPRIHTKAPAYAAPIYNWTGFYIGGHIGGAFSGNNDFNGLVSSDNNNVQFLGGVQVGADYQFAPNWVFGIEYADNRETLASAGVPVGFALDRDHRNGFTVGAGLEYMLAQNWSAKVEYQFYDFDSSRFTTPVALVPFGSFRNEEHTVKAGLNYRFNWNGPLVATY